MNILITEGMIAKISDFGLSKIINELNSIQSSSKGLIGTPR
jgi:serine/threonine protein kinase